MGRCWLRLTLIHFVLCLSFISSKMGVMGRTAWNETDRLALLEFKAKISDDPLGIMRLWNDSTHFCHWYGVRCGTRHQRVTQLNMFELKLGGTISPHIGNLTFLHALRLENNSFIRQIPSEIGRLRRLQELNLRNNILGGEIPLNLSRCSKLEHLILSSNKLEGEIPSALGLLSKLKDLHLPYNNLVGNIPTNLTNLCQLTILSLGSNHLSGEVPSSLFNLSSLEVFDTGTNHLGGERRLPPDLFHTLPNLQFISTCFNEFSGPIPVSLSNASNLQVLELVENKFTGKVPCLENLYMLEWFDVGGNNLGGGDGALKNFLCSLTNATALYYLDIQLNNFKGLLPSCITNLSSKLAIFNVHKNSIFGSIPQGIGNLTSLLLLDFSSNSLTGSISPTIGNLQNLAHLFLDQNSFTGPIPTSFGKLLQLNLLQLSDNSLEGTIPLSLQNCTSLQTLNLDHNYLTGFIPPQVFTLSSLSIGFSASQNQLIGPLPEEVGKLTNLNVLDVSSNMLSGKIPDSIGECVVLVFLYMGGNNFQGPIPSSLSSLKGLQELDLSLNNLSGPIPQLFTSFVNMLLLNLSFNDLQGVVPKKGVFMNASITWLQGNNKLCGGIPDFHLPECSSSPERKKWKFSVKTKITIATVAGFVGVALLILLFYILVLGRKRRQDREEHVAGPSENPPLQFVSYGDLHRACNGFSQGNLLGEGSFGHVYRGILGEGGQVVAIKVLNLNRHGASKSFVAECQALRNIRHKNLVKLLTVCSGIDYQGNEFKALVYEFMSNGSLEDWLHPTLATREDELVEHEQTPQRKLGLFKRLSLSIEVASLLEYAHHEFGSPLVHCDIKPSNILLDDDLSGHVGDFGLAKFLSDAGIIRSSIHPSSSIGVRGTAGYAPLEYGTGSEVSTQGDVYSYGILLLEMFTGKRPTHEMFKDGLNLHLYSKMALPSGVLNILDPTLQDLLEAEEPALNPKRSARVMDCLVSVIEIGVACSLESPAERMDMRMVTAKLHKIRDVLFRGRN